MKFFREIYVNITVNERPSFSTAVVRRKCVLNTFTGFITQTQEKRRRDLCLSEIPRSIRLVHLFTRCHKNPE